MKNGIFIVTSLTLALALTVAGAAAQPQQEEQKPEEQQQQQEPTPFGFDLGTQEQQPPAGPTPEEQLAIEELMRADNAQERLDLALQFLENYPESVFRGRAYATAAEAYRMINDYAQAIEYGERALELSPQDAVTMIIVADSLVESSLPTRENYQDQLARAQDYVARALEILPELFAAMEHRPEVPEEEYLRQQNYVEAQAHAVLGYVYYRQRAYEQAEAELKQSIRLAPDRPNPMDFFRLGYTHVRQREYQEARDVFQQCVELMGERARGCQQQLERMEVILERQASRSGGSRE
ncbi:MAG: tetratricopeptide repeat protein [Candidatus Acidoferrales bacterium]